MRYDGLSIYEDHEDTEDLSAPHTDPGDPNLTSPLHDQLRESFSCSSPSQDNGSDVLMKLYVDLG